MFDAINENSRELSVKGCGKQEGRGITSVIDSAVCITSREGRSASSTGYITRVMSIT
jgi:hypothetical protein